jgi:hypothetical protein
VIAEVPGRDPKAPPILVGGHLDSWDLGTGAIDDASGVAITTAAAKRIMDAGRPLRAIRVVWFGAEEVGPVRRPRLSEEARREDAPCDRESDFGADNIWKVDSKLGKDREAEAKALQLALAPLGIVPGSLEKADGSDIEPMLNAGLPGVGLSQDGTHYFDIHHTPDDTLDKVDPETLRQNVAHGRPCSRCCPAESSRSRNGPSGVKQAKGRTDHAHSFCRSAFLARRLPGDKDDNSTTVSFNEDVAENAAADAGNFAENVGGMIANDVDQTADKVQNEVGDVDVDVNVSHDNDAQRRKSVANSAVVPALPFV